MDYIILTNRDAAMLAREVNQTTAQGWEPLGGVTIEYTGLNKNADGGGDWHFTKYFLQAMIKRDQGQNSYV